MTEPLKAVEADAETLDIDVNDAPKPTGIPIELRTDLGSATVMVPPTGRWKTRATSALNLGNFDEWVSSTLSDEDQEAWAELDPTVDDATEFFKAWSKKSGLGVRATKPKR